MRNFIFGFGVAIIALIAVIVVYQYGVKQGKLDTTRLNVTIPEVETKGNNVSPTQPMVGNDKDEHGCIGSAGYQWCEVKKKCLRSWEESCEIAGANDAEEIKQALIKKHNWTNMEIEVTIGKNDGKYASGGVKEVGVEAGGGMFFAVKDNGVWKIVADGNGIITCDELIPYPDYPVSMIPECYNDKTGQMVKR